MTYEETLADVCWLQDAGALPMRPTRDLRLVELADMDDLRGLVALLRAPDPESWRGQLDRLLEELAEDVSKSVDMQRRTRVPVRWQMTSARWPATCAQVCRVAWPSQLRAWR